MAREDWATHCKDCGRKFREDERHPRKIRCKRCKRLVRNQQTRDSHRRNYVKKKKPERKCEDCGIPIGASFFRKLCRPCNAKRRSKSYEMSRKNRIRLMVLNGDVEGLSKLKEQRSACHARSNKKLLMEYYVGKQKLAELELSSSAPNIKTMTNNEKIGFLIRLGKTVLAEGEAISLISEGGDDVERQ